MIDISEKKIVKREATASGKIFLKQDTIDKIKNKQIKKGDALETAKIAGINGVKQTQILITHCHQIPIDFINFIDSLNVITSAVGIVPASYFSGS